MDRLKRVTLGCVFLLFLIGFFSSNAAAQPVVDLTDLDMGRGIIINPAAFHLYYVENDAVVAKYPIAVGRPRTWTGEHWKVTKTPSGNFYVSSKVADPQWYPPAWLKETRGWESDYVVESGPGNPLGARWIGLSRRGYGIHGTNNLASIGRAVSLGCIRMTNEAVRKLYSTVRVGDPVHIVHSQIQLSLDPQTAETVLELLPPLYDAQELTAGQVAQVLHERGYDRVSQPRLEELVATAASRPVMLPLRARNSLVVNGLTVGQVLVRQEREEQAVYVPLRSTVERLGMTITNVNGDSVVVDGRTLPGCFVDGRFMVRWEVLTSVLGIGGVWLDQERQLYIWGVRVKFFGHTATQNAFIEDGAAYVSIESLADSRLGAFFSLTSEGTALVLGEPVESRLRGDDHYVAVRLIAEKLGARTYWNPRTRMVTVTYS